MRRSSQRVRHAPAVVRVATARVQIVTADVRVAPSGVRCVSIRAQRVSARVQRARSRIYRARFRVLRACRRFALIYAPATSTNSQKSTPMNNCELARTTCFDNMPAFGKAKATALADDAADSDGRKKAKAKARAKFGELDALDVAIGKEVAKQQSGGKAVGTTSRGVLRDALTGDFREWNRTAEVAVGKGGGW